MIAKECINVRLGDKVYNRVLDSNGFIVEKSKLPKGYDGSVTKYIQLIAANFKGLFSITKIDFGYTDKLVYIEVEPLSLNIAPN